MKTDINIKGASSSGFSLIEIVIAVGILSFAMIPIINSSQQSVRMTGYNIYRVTGSNLCMSIIDRYKNSSYEDLIKMFGQGDDYAQTIISNDPALNSTGLPADHAAFIKKFQRSAIIEEIVDEPNLAKFTAVVRWKSHPRRPPTVFKLTRIIVNYDRIGIKPISASGNYSFTRCDSTTDKNRETGIVDARALKKFWRDFGG